MSPKFVQIAGVTSQQEADLLISCGVKYIGFPLRLPVNIADISEDKAAEIIKKLPDDIEAILITYLNKHDEIIGLCNKLSVNYLQLHGSIDRSELKMVKQSKPDLYIIKSLVIGEQENKALFRMIDDLEPYVDAFITDTYDSNSGASGATGLTHDWKISQQLVRYSSKPVILAGGLTPDNLKNAIQAVRPFGVDAHTGVENLDGYKDRVKVERFIQIAEKYLLD